MDGIKKALTYFENKLNEYEDIKINTFYMAELYNMTQFSYLASLGAYNRKESVGAHYIEE